MIRKGLIGLLLANGPVQQRVGTRVFPDKLPQGTVRPALVIEQSGGSHEVSMNQGRIGLCRPTMRVWCLADTGSDANALADVVRSFLNGFRGRTPDGGFIQGAFEQSVSDDLTPPLHADDQGVHATPLEFLVCHSE